MIKYIGLLLLSVLMIACNNSVSEESLTLDGETKHVSIQKNEKGTYQFHINDQAFALKGVGFETTRFEELKAAGGNAFRTWRTDNAHMELDSAAKYGLMVAMGLDIGKELHDFDYNDEAAVKEQLERLKKEVLEFKDHPNLLCWVAGNELNLLFDENGGLKLVNPKTYIALNELVEYIHEVDPNHPVTTTFAGGSKEHVGLCRKHCPDLDFLSYQIYGDLGAIHEIAKQAAPDMPFAVTEFGPKGHWEMPATQWGREIEEPSTVKARGYADRMKRAFGQNPDGLCLGGFAFLWGQKQERTPTWYGVLGKDGESTETVDELTKIWTGNYPSNRAPIVNQISIIGKGPTDNLFLKPESTYTASVEYSDPEGRPLNVQYFIMNEVKERSQGGAFEQEPEVIDFDYEVLDDGKIKFTSPGVEGDYRLFVYVHDDGGKLGYSNMPFYITDKKASQLLPELN